MKENILIRYPYASLVISSFSCSEKFCILTFENENRIKKSNAQHGKDQFFYNRTDYNRKIFVKANYSSLQSLYKYLANSVIDFYYRILQRNFVAVITHRPSPKSLDIKILNNSERS